MIIWVQVPWEPPYIVPIFISTASPTAHLPLRNPPVTTWWMFVEWISKFPGVRFVQIGLGALKQLFYKQSVSKSSLEIALVKSEWFCRVARGNNNLKELEVSLKAHIFSENSTEGIKENIALQVSLRDSCCPSWLHGTCFQVPLSSFSSSPAVNPSDILGSPPDRCILPVIPNQAQ